MDVQDRENLMRLTRNSLSHVNPESESRVDSRYSDPFLAAQTVHQFYVVLLDFFLRNKFFATRQFVGNFLCDFLDEVSSSSVFLHTSIFSLSELDLTIDWFDVVVVVEIQFSS